MAAEWQQNGSRMAAEWQQNDASVYKRNVGGTITREATAASLLACSSYFEKPTTLTWPFPLLGV
jgi:hypothetical protein